MTHDLLEAVMDATRGTGWFVLGYFGVICTVIVRRHL